MRIEHRDVGLALNIKVDGRDLVERSHRILYGCHQYLPDGLLVFELDFSLCRVDIYVNIFRLHIEINEVRHLFTLWQKPVEGRQNGLTEIRMTHKTPVDKEILSGPFLPCRFGLTHKTADSADRSIDLDRKKVLVDTLSEDVDNALTERRRAQIVHL